MKLRKPTLPKINWRLKRHRQPVIDDNLIPEAESTGPLALPESGGGLPESKPKTKRGFRKRRPTIHRELVYIYEDGCKWTATIPTSDLIDNLPLNCRWAPAAGDIVYRIVGMSIITTLLIGSFTGLLYLAIPSIGVAVFGGFMVGLPLGAGGGWLLGAPIGKLILRGSVPGPFWVMRRFPWETMPAEYQEAVLAASGEQHPYVIIPQFHTRELGRNLQSDTPGVFTGTSWHEMMEARAVRRWFTGKASWGRRIQLASMGVMAACMIGVVLFLILATLE
jgi:hypothetical protein